jgi:two-component system osmolarity sensor histidine kinase EnvZ
MRKHLLPRSLFGRSLLLIITPVVILEGVAAYVFYERHWDTVARRLAVGLAGEIAMIIDSLPENATPERRARLVRLARDDFGIRADLKIGANLPGEPAPTGLGNRILDRMLNAALGERFTQPFRIDTTSFGDEVEVQVQLDEGVLRILTQRKRLTSTTTELFIMWMVGTSVVLVAVAVLFLRNQMRPIRRLAEAADRLGKGRETGPIKPSGATEVRQATVAFLAMRERLQRQIGQRTEMLAGVSHDLRAPITRMKLQLEMLPESDSVTNLKSDVADMETMVEAYLRFARGADSEAPVPTDLPALLERIAADARRRGGAVELAVAGDMVVPLRPNAFRRGITNLIDNARAAANTVAVTAARSGDSIEITIDDDGGGIPEAEREAVFKPFYRLDQARSPDAGGVGLGLTIAREVMRSHGGDVTLTRAPLGGLRAQIRLPI